MHVETNKAIQVMYDEYLENYDKLLKTGQIGFANDYKSQFSKVLLLSAASFFEVDITQSLKIVLGSQNCSLVSNFLDKKALSRQFHTFFQWDKGVNGANQLFGYLGKEFSEFMKVEKDANPDLAQSIADFILIGSQRNLMVHGNYATFNLELTPEDVYDKFKSALIFSSKFIELTEKFKAL
jgi:hypothetical protein